MRRPQQADLRVSEAADALGLHPETIRQLARRGEFPNSYKTGKGGRTSPTRIPYTDIEDFRKRQPRTHQ